MSDTTSVHTNDTHRQFFDGFCYRPFNPDIDGWRDEISKSEDYECVRQAQSVLDLFDDLRATQKENWKLRKENEEMRAREKRVFGF